MKRLRFFPIVLLAIGLAGILGFSRPVSLIKISKTDAEIWDFLKAHQIEVLQELQSCFLARADRQDIAALRSAGVSVVILDRDIRGRAYTLVPAVPPEISSQLVRKGWLLEVEPETFIFWTETEDPMSVLPPGLPRKPLPEASVLSYLTRPQALPEGRLDGQSVNDLISQLVSEVSEDNLRAVVQALQEFKTRYVSTPNCDAAGQFLLNSFQSLGLDIRFQDVPYGSGAVSKNIVADLPGRVYPQDVLIICGHYDSTSDQRFTLAPGADDNASGTAAVLEAARILVRYPLDFTVRFIAFTAEEIGLYGSRVYAQDARRRGERIIGVVNLDMIAYADEMPEDLEIIVNPASEWLARKLLAVSRAYGLVPAKITVNASFVYSDHAAFWENGYAALLGIEDNPLGNPFYHKTTDTVGSLNFVFFREATKAALAGLAELAQPVRPGYPATPAGLSAESHVYRSLFGAIQVVHLSWPPRSGASGYNIYRSEVSHLDYQKLNSSPLPAPSYIDRDARLDRWYYYVVSAVGTSGLESNFSREVMVPPWTSVSPSLLLEGFYSLQGGRG